MKLKARQEPQPKSKKRSLFVDLAWVGAFLSLCTLIYHFASKKDDELLSSLMTTHEQLKSLKDEAVFLRKELIAQIDSQKDAEWVELLLKEKLGVVPRGQTKIFFEFSESP